MPPRGPGIVWGHFRLPQLGVTTGVGVARVVEHPAGHRTVPHPPSRHTPDRSLPPTMSLSRVRTRMLVHGPDRVGERTQTVGAGGAHKGRAGRDPDSQAPTAASRSSLQSSAPALPPRQPPVSDRLPLGVCPAQKPGHSKVALVSATGSGCGSRPARPVCPLCPPRLPLPPSRARPPHGDPAAPTSPMQGVACLCVCACHACVCACVCVRTPLPAKRGVHVCVRALQPAELALEVSPQSRQSSCKTLSTTRVLFRRNVLAEPPPPRAPVPPRAVRTPLASGASAPRDGCDNPESASVAPAPAWGLRGGPAAELLLVKMLTLACRGTRAGLPTGPRPPCSHACVFPAFISAQARAVLLICGFFFPIESVAPWIPGFTFSDSANRGSKATSSRAQRWARAG